MQLRPSVTDATGLMMRQGELIIAHLRRSQSGISLEKILHLEIDDHTSDGIVNPLYTAEQFHQLVELLDRTLSVTALSSVKLLTRDLKLDLTNEGDIDAVLPFQLESQIPFSIEEASIDRVIKEYGEEHTSVTAFLALKSDLDNHIALWNSLEIEPEIITCAPLALACFDGNYLPKESSLIHLHFGNETSFVAVENGKLFASHGIEKSFKDLEKAYSADAEQNKIATPFAQLSLATLDEALYPRLTKTVQTFRSEITQYLLALQKQVGNAQLKRVLITGFSKEKSGIAKALIPPPFELITPPPEVEELGEFALPIGQAIAALANDEKIIDFRKGSFAYPHPWRRWKTPLILYFSLCTLFALSLFLFGMVYMDRKEKQIKLEYLDLLAVMKKHYPAFEKEKDAPSLTTKEIIREVTHLSDSELRERLKKLDQEIRETPDQFALRPNVPTVSDLLAWLGSLPLIRGEEGDQQNPRITLDSFSYRMIQRPEKNKKKEKYQVKVDLEFSTSVPRYAREFHDLLLAPNDFVGSDVKWSTEPGIYRASFYLKDKTRYPSSL